MLHQIGTGTLGPVYCAYDPQRDRVLAVKLFTPDLAADRARQLVADFERLITADLGHPGIVAPVATGIAGSSPFLAHQYVEAESFDDPPWLHDPLWSRCAVSSSLIRI